MRTKFSGAFKVVVLLLPLLWVRIPSPVGAEELSNPSVRTSPIVPTGFEPVDTPAESSGTFQRNSVLSAIHLGLGYATVAAGFATGLFNPEVAGEDLHKTLGYTSAALAGATMVFGFLAHYGEVGPGFKWSSNNVHALLGIAGGSMMMIAPFLAPRDSHKYVGATGALLMGVSVGWKLVY